MTALACYELDSRRRRPILPPRSTLPPVTAQTGKKWTVATASAEDLLVRTELFGQPVLDCSRHDALQKKVSRHVCMGRNGHVLRIGDVVAFHSC
jgi:hypothetical protein